MKKYLRPPERLEGRKMLSTEHQLFPIGIVSTSNHVDYAPSSSGSTSAVQASLLLNATSVDRVLAAEGEPLSERGLDVNGDNQISPQDAIHIINYLVLHGARTAIPVGRAADLQGVAYQTEESLLLNPELAGATCHVSGTPKLDVNRDGYISPTDALTVIGDLYVNGGRVIPESDLTKGQDCIKNSLRILRQPSSGFVEVKEDGSLEVHTDPFFVGSEEFIYQFMDELGQPVRGKGTYNILPNSPPTVFPQPPLIVQPGGSGQTSILTGDINGDPVNVTLAGQPNFGVATLTDGILVYTPNPGVSNTTDSVPYRMRDPKGGESIGFFQIIVGEGIEPPVDPPNPPNGDQPIVDAPEQVDVVEGTTTVVATAIHPDNPLDCSIVFPPQLGSLNIAESSLQSGGEQCSLSYTAPNNYRGTVTVLIGVNGRVIRQFFNINSVVPSAAPEDEPPTLTTLTEEEQHEQSVDALMGQL